MKVSSPNLAGSLQLLVAVLLLGGCATSYHSADFAGGYSETQLAPDSFRVVFNGNWHTAEQQAKDFALLRAAEISLQHGFGHFAVTAENTSASIQTIAPPAGFVPDSGDFNGKTYADHQNYQPTEVRTFSKYQTMLVIHCYKAKPEGTSALDAAFLQQSLKEKYHVN